MQTQRTIRILGLGFAGLLFAGGGGGLVAAQTVSGGAVATANFNASSLKADGSYNRFIVRYRDGTAEQSNAAAAAQNISAAVARAGMLSIKTPSVSYKRKLATGSHLFTTSRKLSQAEAIDFMQSIAADPAVAYVAPDVMRQAVRDIQAALPAAFVPNDPNYAKYQTDYLPADGTLTPANGVANWGGANISGAWSLADGTGVVIAVLDTGIVKHADINTSLGDAGYDFISDALVSGRSTDDRATGGWDLGDWTTGNAYLVSKGGCVDSSHPAQASSWHGTHVASASGAELTNNGMGMAGMAYGAKILPVRVLGHCGGYDSDINDAIVWAAGGHVDGVPDNPNPAKVINLSLGGGGACPATDDAALAIAKANALGAAVVVAAGNSSDNVANYSPASCPGAITVASLGISSKLAFYSNYNASGGNIIALGAFGGGVYVNDASSGTRLNPEGYAWQAINTGTTTPVASPGGDTYGGFAGTSQATPHVTAAVALMQSARLAAQLPLLTPAQAKNILQSTARVPHVAPVAAATFGAGVLDAGAAVAAAVASEPSPPPVDTSIPLSNGVQLTGQSGATGASTVYKLNVPAGALALTLRTLGGTGNVSLYVKVGSPGSATNYDYKSVNPGNAESVAIARPVAATYYITVVGEAGYSGVTVLGNYTVPKS